MEIAKKLPIEKRKSMEFAEFRPIEQVSGRKKPVLPSRISSKSSNPLVNLLNSIGGINSIGFDKYLPAEIPLQTTQVPEEQPTKKKSVGEQMATKFETLNWIFKKKDEPLEAKTSTRSENKIERLDPKMEKYTYQISHMKLCEPDRPLVQRLLITNLMLYVIAIQTEMNIRGFGVKRTLKPKLKVIKT